MDILLKSLGLVLYIVLSPLFAVAEAIIVITKYLVNEVAKKVCLIKSKAGNSFQSLAEHNVKEKEPVKNLNWF